MRIVMLVGLAGNAYTLGPGDERDFPDAEAIRLIDAGYAAPVAAQAVERAVNQPIAERRGKRGKNVVPRNGDAAAGG